MRKASIGVAALFSVMLGSRSALAQVPPPADPVEGQVEAVAASSAPGARRTGPFLRWGGGSGQHFDWTLAFEAGRCYTLVGVGGPGVQALSLYLWGPSGKRITEHKAGGPQSLIMHCAYLPGLHRVQAKIGKGMGEIRVGVYATQGAAPVVAAAPATVAPTGMVVQAPPPLPRNNVAPSRSRGQAPPASYAVVAPPPPPPRVVVAAAPPPPPPPRAYVAPPPPPPRAYVAPPAVAYAPPPPPPAWAAPPPVYVAPAAQAPAAPSSPFSFSSSSTRTETHTTTTSTTAPGNGARGADGCDGDWELGQMAMVNSRNPPGIECNDYYAPTNCPTGMYIKMHSLKKCFCIARCTEYVSRPAEGAACNQDGSFVCDHYQSLSSKNHSVFCASTAWNLCRK